MAVTATFDKYCDLKVLFVVDAIFLGHLHANPSIRLISLSMIVQ